MNSFNNMSSNTRLTCTVPLKGHGYTGRYDGCQKLFDFYCENDKEQES